MQNSNRRHTRRTRPGRDPVLLALWAGCAVAAVIVVALAVALLRTSQSQAAVHCPPPDHIVYAASLHQWLCGASWTGGVKSR